MGLPVITVSGTRHAARVGASLLTAAGCPRQIASDADAFTRLAADACRTSDPAARLQAKTARRAALLASPLCDAKAFASRWQAALLALAQSPQ
jgi:predicted O-linked N-acetylglucosamine transferase (SPINDLY family)